LGSDGNRRLLTSRKERFISNEARKFCAALPSTDVSGARVDQFYSILLGACRLHVCGFTSGI